MGECGCGIGNKCFKLRAPKGWYIIELLSGCDYCCVSPGICVHHPKSIDPMFFGFDTIEDMEFMPDLPIIGEGECCISMIKCGLDSDEAMDAAAKCFSGMEIDDGKIDEAMAELLGVDFWKDALSTPPSVVYPVEGSEEDKNDQG